MPALSCRHRFCESSHDEVHRPEQHLSQAARRAHGEVVAQTNVFHRLNVASAARPSFFLRRDTELSASGSAPSVLAFGPLVFAKTVDWIPADLVYPVSNGRDGL